MVEAIAALPLLAIFSSTLLFSFYFLIVNLWSDHWVYRTNICIVEGGSRWSCQKNLEQKMQILVPPRYYRVRHVWKTPRHSHVSLSLLFAGSAETDFLGTLHKVISSDIDLPLHSSNLSRDLL